MSLEHSLELDVIRGQMAAGCATVLGREKLENLSPSYEPLIIRRENGRLREALSACVHYGSMPFEGIRDLGTVLVNAQKGRTLTGLELAQTAAFIHGLRKILSYERAIEEPHPELKDLTGTLIVHEALARHLEACVDPYGEVKDDASPQLSSLRRQLRQADAAVAQAVQNFIRTHGDSVVDSIVSYRNDRAVILVRAADKNLFKGLVYGDSASGQASYIEPPQVIAANNRKQQLIDEESREVQKILAQCSQEVGAVADQELSNLETCALLDALFAKAAWGVQRDGCAAQLTEARTLKLVKARHPLIDPEKVVANDYTLADPYRTLLITGPNTGGKTVSMKIMGLFTLMTYCGMPILCQTGIIPYFDAVYADIGDDQSVVSSLSSFSAHVEKQAEAAVKATSSSLVLLDEIGSGTDPREGEALAIALLNELRQRGAMIVATTHYSRLKAYGKRHDDILVASVEFDMQQLAPTYRYLEGVTGSSNALEVAERCGLPESIIREARFLKNQAKTQEDQLIEQLDQQLSASRRKNEEMDARLEEIKTYQRKLEAEKNQFEKEKDEWRSQVQEETDRITEEARQQADEILRHMRKRQKNAPYHEMLAERQKLREKQPEEKTSSSAVSENYTYQPGDVVELRANGQVARVVRLQRKDITIDLNGREIHVKASQIRPSLKVLPSLTPAPEVSMRSARIFDSFSAECNLIGMHVDEAVEALDAYISDARLHGLQEFRVIHGDGSGALRQAVHNRLRKRSDVASFSLAPPQQGGSGATIVKMK